MYRALRLKDFVQGKITSELWEEETGRFSRLLHEAGVDLGHICQSSEVKQDEKYPKYVQRMVGLYGEMAVALKTKN